LNKRVLYWAEAFWPTIGGIEVFSTNLISALKNQGYEFLVVTDHRSFNMPDEMLFQGTPVYRFHFQRLLEKQDISQIAATRRRVAELKQTFRPDLIHMNACGPAVFFHLSTADAYPLPALVTVHALLKLSGGSDTILGHLLRTAGWVSAVSAAVLNDVRRLHPEIAQRSSVIYNSLALPSEQPEPLPFSAPRLLCVGRLVKDKGFDTALTAFALVAKRFPDARMVIAGDGPASSGLMQLASRLGLTDTVEFIGWVDPQKIPELINTVTAVIVPSRWDEPFGLVALQAAHMARPVVATRVGGLPEVVIHGETGLLVDREDVDALAEAIAFLLANPGIATRIGSSAKIRAEDLFNWDRFVNTYDSLYRQLIREDSVFKMVNE